MELSWSDETAILHGHPPDVPPPPLRELLARCPRADRITVLRAFHTILRLRRPIAFRYRVNGWDDRPRSILASMDFETDETGRIIAVHGTLHDASGVAGDLAHRENLYRRLLDAIEASRNPFALYDGEDRLVICNTAYKDIYDRSNIALGATFEDNVRSGLLTGQYTEAIGREEDFLRERLARHREPKGAFPQRLSDGRWILVDEHRTASGDTVSVRTDITDLKRTEAALKQAREAAERANQAKSEFLSNISHELRTPLNAILGFSQLLADNLREPLTPRQREHVAAILKSGEHLLALINEILDLTSIEAGHMRVHIHDIAVDEVIESCLSAMRPVAEKQGVRITGENRGAIASVRADRGRLQQVLTNLLSNAIKYNRPDGAATLVVERGPLGARFLVKDTGLGIAEEQQAQLFQPFNRLGRERSGIEGTGIGLSLTQRLVHLMHGEIGLSSQPGVGTTFWVDLPAKGSGDAAGLAKDGPGDGPGSGPGNGTPPTNRFDSPSVPLTRGYGGMRQQDAYSRPETLPGKTR